LLSNAFCVWEPVREELKLGDRKEAQDQVWTKKVSHFPEATAEEEDQINAVFKSHLIEEDYHSKH